MSLDPDLSSPGATVTSQQPADTTTSPQVALAAERESMERRQSAAAKRILEEAQSVGQHGASLEMWRQRAQEVVSVEALRRQLQSGSGFVHEVTFHWAA